MARAKAALEGGSSMDTLKPVACQLRRSVAMHLTRPCLGRDRAAAVVAAVLLSIAQLLQPAHANSTYVLPQLINVCCIQNEGFSTCQPGSDIRSYHGVDVLLLQESFRRMNILDAAGDPLGGAARAAPGTARYQMYCLDESVRPTAALSEFSNNATKYLMCDMFIGGITLTAKRAASVQTTRPHVDDSVTCLCRNERKLVGVGSGRAWEIVNVFESSVWELVGSMSLAVITTLVVVEAQRQAKRVPIMKEVPTLWQAGFYHMLHILRVPSEVQRLSFPCQAMVLMYFLTGAFCIAAYTAGLAALLTQQVDRPVISSLADMRRARVLVHTPYLPWLERLGIKAEPVLYPGASEFKRALLPRLLRRDVDVLCFDGNMMRTFYAEDRDSLHILSAGLPRYSETFALSHKLPAGFVRDLDVVIQAIKEDGLVSAWCSTTLQPEVGPGSSGTFYAIIRTHLVWGLTMVVCCAVALALLYLVTITVPLLDTAAAAIGRGAGTVVRFLLMPVGAVLDACGLIQTHADDEAGTDARRAKRAKTVEMTDIEMGFVKSAEAKSAEVKPCADGGSSSAEGEEYDSDELGPLFYALLALKPYVLSARERVFWLAVNLLPLAPLAVALVRAVKQA